MHDYLYKFTEFRIEIINKTSALDMKHTFKNNERFNNEFKNPNNIIKNTKSYNVYVSQNRSHLKLRVYNSVTALQLI